MSLNHKTFPFPPILMLCLAFLTVLAAGCTPAAPEAIVESPILPSRTVLPSSAPKPTSTATAAPSPTAQPPTATPSYPQDGVGPLDYPAGYNPLTGLKVIDPDLLDRLPMIVKVVNIPRYTRPQYGLSLADHVYEYYTEEGSTRFAAVYYGQDAEKVGGIRSARYFDISLIQMYKAIFAFGRADEQIIQKLYKKDFADRLVIELPDNCPPICRFAPDGQNMLVVDTRKLNPYLENKGIDIQKPDLNGLSFTKQTPEGGRDIGHVYVRYSGAIYNRWDYDPVTGRYQRWVDTKNDYNHANEVYAQLTDALTGDPILADNVVVLWMEHTYLAFTEESQTVDMHFLSDGTAYAARDGKFYTLEWKRDARSSMLQLVYPDGSPYPLKPGNTWFEVIGESSKKTVADDQVRFEFAIP
jgi:hypothetical protein